MVDSQEGPDFDASTVNEKSSPQQVGEDYENEKQAVPDLSDADFPDGGLRAWLVIAGVRRLPTHLVHLSDMHADDSRHHVDVSVFIAKDA
jgi:hypothetical protein